MIMMGCRVYSYPALSLPKKKSVAGKAAKMRRIVIWATLLLMATDAMDYGLSVDVFK